MAKQRAAVVEGEQKGRQATALIVSLAFSLVLTVFPVASGVIVVMNDLSPLQGYWIQGASMLLSIALPAAYWAKTTKMKLSQIGLCGTESGSAKTVLYFMPAIAAKTGFLVFGINSDLQRIAALAFFASAIGLSEEIYFRGMVLRRLLAGFTTKQAAILSSVFFASVHVSQAFSGATGVTVALTIGNALLFGIVASEIVILTKSILPTILWHALYDFLNWSVLIKGAAETGAIIIQSVILLAYAACLWLKLPEEVRSSPCPNQPQRV